MILGLDCATKTGFCLWHQGKVYESGVMDFSKRRGESNGLMFLRFRHWLNGILTTNKIRLVTYELAHMRGGAATEISANLTGRVQELCTEHGIQYASVHSATLKKFATGKGNADKADMILTAQKFKLGVTSDDESDAIHLAHFASEEYGEM